MENNKKLYKKIPSNWDIEWELLEIKSILNILNLAFSSDSEMPINEYLPTISLLIDKVENVLKAV